MQAKVALHRTAPVLRGGWLPRSDIRPVGSTWPTVSVQGAMTRGFGKYVR